jgi:hypothetical protein
MTPARAAEVLRKVGNADYREECVAGEMGANAIELLEWLYATSPDGVVRISDLFGWWHGEDSFLDYCRAEWEKERNGNGNQS